MSKTPDVNSGVPWLGAFLSYKKQYGIFSIIISIILLFVFIMVLRICYDPTFIWEGYQKYQESRHEIQQIQRIENDEQINNILPSLIVSTSASRAWIIQYHNGTSDWSYGSMRFELCLDEVPTVQYQYSDFHLSWLKLPSYLRKHEYFIGDLGKLSAVDHVIYDRLEMNEISYMACILIKSHNKEIGILGLTWAEVPKMSDQEILLMLTKYAGKIEEFLVPQTK